MTSATTARFGFGLEYTRDIDATRRFFTDVLGLEVDREAPNFVQFKDRSGAAYAIASDQPIDPSQNGAPELWWIVDDAESAYKNMSSAAEVSLGLRQMPFGKCFGVRNPAGQIHYVVELAQQRPSQQVS